MKIFTDNRSINHNKWWNNSELKKTYFLVIAQWRFQATWSTISFPKKYVAWKIFIGIYLFPHFDATQAYHWKNYCLSWYLNKNDNFLVDLGGVVFVTTDFFFFFHMSHNYKILIIKHVFIADWSISSLGTVLLAGLKWLRNNLSTTWYDLTPTGQRGKSYEKIFFAFVFHILHEHRRISGRIFPWHCISIKNSDHPWGRCWPIYLESKPSLNCWIAVERAEITFISIHINANQNSFHDDKSIL